MIGVYILLGTICAFAGTITVLDYLGRRQRDKARKSG